MPNLCQINFIVSRHYPFSQLLSQLPFSINAPTMVLLCSFLLTFLYLASPSASTNLQLSLLPSLTLEWSRPSVPAFTQLQVPISYTVEINATEESGMSFTNITSDTSLSVQYLEDMLRDSERECVEFEFIVSATNDAGTGPLATIQDTIPICEYYISSCCVNHIYNVLQLEEANLDGFPSFFIINTC